ncbi:MAG: Gldg family protein, partial [Bryobacteraceae bacterium]
FCGVPVFVEHAGVIATGWTERLAVRLSAVEQFRDLAAGVVTPGPLVYFASLAAVAMYLNVALTGRRRWRSARMRWHAVARALSLAVMAAGATTLASTARVRLDVTAEKIHSLSAQTRSLLGALSPRQPVFIHAYFSADVPRSYVDARTNLAAMLREFDAVGGESVHTRIVETLKYSPAAREAQERYGIRPFRVPASEESARAPAEIFLGLVFTCGAEEFTIPFFDRGLPVEYELMRSIRVVSRARRKKIGILETGAKLFGALDYQTKTQTQDWSIVAELRKQYEVVKVAPGAEYPADLDALIAALPTSLAQAQVDRLAAYVKAGKPALLLLDPMPAFDLNLAPQEIAETASPFAMAPPPAPRANVKALLDAAGVAWQTNRIAWDNYNPHPQLKSLPKEFVFVGKGFNPKEAITAGLQEVVLLYPGTLKGKGLIPLLETGVESGTVRWEDLVQRSMFGIAMNPNLARSAEDKPQVLAGRAGNTIVVADVDLMGEQFFELRRRGIENLNFDNVTFLLNAVDQLAGDASFIALRKRRPRHRTLEAVEARTRTYETQRLRDTQTAEAVAEQRLKEAQARLDRAVREIQQRADLDEQTRQIMISNVQSVENRRLTVARANIEDEKQRQIELSRAEMENSIRGIQNTIKLLAVALPPIPAFVIFLLVSARRLRRERMGAGDRWEK